MTHVKYLDESGDSNYSILVSENAFGQGGDTQTNSPARVAFQLNDLVRTVVWRERKSQDGDKRKALQSTVVARDDMTSQQQRGSLNSTCT